jgi:hypothetical protein
VWLVKVQVGPAKAVSVSHVTAQGGKMKTSSIFIFLGVLLDIVIFFVAGFDFGYKSGRNAGFVVGVKMGSAKERLIKQAEDGLFWQMLMDRPREC